MKLFLKLGAYIFHPLWMPFFGALLYFVISPRFFPESIVGAKILAIAILTVFIPIVFFFLLKNLGLATSIQLKNVKERRLPLLFFALLIFTAINFILNNYAFTELFFFYSGILYSASGGLVLALLKIKASLHMIGISGLTVFVIALSIAYNTNLTYIIGVLFFAMGWVASSRLHTKAHNNKELVLGVVVGGVPQLLLFATELYAL